MDKFGYFGSDFEAYVHYMQSINENFPSEEEDDEAYLYDDCSDEEDSDDEW